MIKKYILTILLFWVCSIATSQIMLPAYQGVFSTNDVKFKINVGTIEGWIKTGNGGSSYRAAFGKHRAYCLYLYNNTLAIYDWGGAANRSTGITLNDNTWQGGIANVRAYNKALTNSEIMFLYISTKGVFGY